MMCNENYEQPRSRFKRQMHLSAEINILNLKRYTFITYGSDFILSSSKSLNNNNSVDDGDMERCPESKHFR